MVKLITPEIVYSAVASALDLYFTQTLAEQSFPALTLAKAVTQTSCPLFTSSFKVSKEDKSRDLLWPTGKLPVPFALLGLSSYAIL